MQQKVEPTVEEQSAEADADRLAHDAEEKLAAEEYQRWRDAQGFYRDGVYD